MAEGHAIDYVFSAPSPIKLQDFADGVASVVANFATTDTDGMNTVI